MKILRLLLILCVFAPAASFAQPHFLSAIPDVPLMEGLQELPDHTLSFDKPEGRIVESIVEIDGVSPGAVQAYYNDTLPQFGWHPAGGGKYTRHRELLQLSFEVVDGQEYLKFMVMPRE